MSTEYNPLVYADYQSASRNISSQNIAAKLSLWGEIQQQLKSLAQQAAAHKVNTKQYAFCINAMQELGQKYIAHCMALEPEYLRKLVLCAQLFAAKDAHLDTSIVRKMLETQQKPKSKRSQKK